MGVPCARYQDLHPHWNHEAASWNATQPNRASSRFEIPNWSPCISRLLLSCKWHQTAKWNCFGEACAQQMYFRSSLLSLQKILERATTGNTSAVRRLKAGSKQTNFDIFKFIRGSKDWGNKAKKCVIHCWASRWLHFLCLGASKLKAYFKIHQNWFVPRNSPIVYFETTTTLYLRNLKIERFRMSSRRPC